VGRVADAAESARLCKAYYLAQAIQKVRSPSDLLRALCTGIMECPSGCGAFLGMFWQAPPDEEAPVSFVNEIPSRAGDPKP
jgi:hypothetical protein